MKTAIRLSIVLIMLVGALLPAYSRAPGSKVGVTFDRTEADFGSVPASEGPVHLEYTMTNGSDKAVVILSARASCGCTEPEYPRHPVMPGERAVVKVNFNTVGQRGEVDKEVTLRLKRADGKSEKVQLILKGVVIPAD